MIDLSFVWRAGPFCWVRSVHAWVVTLCLSCCGLCCFGSINRLTGAGSSLQQKTSVLMPWLRLLFRWFWGAGLVRTACQCRCCLDRGFNKHTHLGIFDRHFLGDFLASTSAVLRRLPSVEKREVVLAVENLVFLMTSGTIAACAFSLEPLYSSKVQVWCAPRVVINVSLDTEGRTLKNTVDLRLSQSPRVGRLHSQPSRVI